MGPYRSRLDQRIAAQRASRRRVGGSQARRRDRARNLTDHVRARVGARRTMLEPVSVGLKFGFLAVLYLFLLWVAWSAMRDLRRGRGGVIETDRAPSQDATGMYDAAAGLGELDEFEPRLLVERASGHEAGIAYDLMDGA